MGIGGWAAWHGMAAAGSTGGASLASCAAGPPAGTLASDILIGSFVRPYLEPPPAPGSHGRLCANPCLHVHC
jgi:hypothetical protein